MFKVAKSEASALPAFHPLQVLRKKMQILPFLYQEEMYFSQGFRQGLEPEPTHNYLFDLLLRVDSCPQLPVLNWKERSSARISDRKERCSLQEKMAKGGQDEFRLGQRLCYKL